MTILKPKGVDRPAQMLNETTGCQEAIEQTKATIVEPTLPTRPCARALLYCGEASPIELHVWYQNPTLCLQTIKYHCRVC